MELYRLIVDTESEDTNLIQETILRADHKWKDVKEKYKNIQFKSIEFFRYF